MIHSVIEDADIGESKSPNAAGPWMVKHPSNGAILAYCSTKEEASMYREAINDIPRLLREVGMSVK